MKSRIGLTVLLIALSTCASSSALARKGGRSDGGGNLHGERSSVDFQRLTSALEGVWSNRLRLVMAFLERRMDWDNYTRDPSWIVAPGEFPQPIHYEIDRKLFRQGSGKSVYDTLMKFNGPNPELRWAIKDEGPCLDNGEAKDASVTDPVTKDVCFSASLLIPQLNQYDTDLRITALAAHELGHLMDLDEDEANELQRLMSQAWKEQIATGRLVDDHNLASWEKLQKNLKETLNLTAEVSQKLSAGASFSEACQPVLKAAKEAASFASLWIDTEPHPYKDLFVSTLRGAGQKELIAIAAKGFALQSACASNRSDNNDEYQKQFGGQSRISLQAYLTDNGTQYFSDAPFSEPRGLFRNPPAFSAGEDIHYIAFGDVASLEAEIQNVRLRAETLKNMLDAAWSGDPLP